MKRSFRLQILLVSFILSVACWSIRIGSGTFIFTTASNQNDAVSLQPYSAPNTELEGSHFQTASVSHITVQKDAAIIHSSSLRGFYKQRSAENLQIKRSSLFIKDYLFHIYPSQNFW